MGRLFPPSLALRLRRPRWTGTDTDGNALLSSDSRFSMFPPNRIEESVTGAYDKMLKDLKNMKDTSRASGNEKQLHPCRYSDSEGKVIFVCGSFSINL